MSGTADSAQDGDDRGGQECARAFYSVPTPGLFVSAPCVARTHDHGAGILQTFVINFVLAAIAWVVFCFIRPKFPKAYRARATQCVSRSRELCVHFCSECASIERANFECCAASVRR